MSRLVFLDTETTSLRADRRAWEVGAIVRDEGRPDTEHGWFVTAGDLDLGYADPSSLKIGRFYQRHPEAMNRWATGLPGCFDEYCVLTEVEQLTRGAHLVGAVVSFDAEVLGERMRAHGICPSWHYHLIDVEALAIGYLAHSTARDSSGRELSGSVTALPWKSDTLTAALGIEVSDDQKHTALGDARWARAIYDAVMGSPAVDPLTLEREEFEFAQRIWTFLLASGHANCGAWQRDPGWAAGHVECACGQIVLVPWGKPC